MGSFIETLRVTARDLIAGSPKDNVAAFEDLRAKRAAASLIPPDQFFKTGDYEGLYSQYDERGVPTHDIEGKEVAKSQLKKLTKLYEGQVKKYAKAEEAGRTGGAEAAS